MAPEIVAPRASAAGYGGYFGWRKIIRTSQLSHNFVVSGIRSMKSVLGKRSTGKLVSRSPWRRWAEHRYPLPTALVYTASLLHSDSGAITLVQSKFKSTTSLLSFSVWYVWVCLCAQNGENVRRQNELFTQSNMQRKGFAGPRDAVPYRDGKILALPRNRNRAYKLTGPNYRPGKSSPAVCSWADFGSR